MHSSGVFCSVRPRYAPVAPKAEAALSAELCAQPPSIRSHAGWCSVRLETHISTRQVDESAEIVPVQGHCYQLSVRYDCCCLGALSKSGTNITLRSERGKLNAVAAMDGVSAAASIWALVEGTGKVIKYLKSVKTARRDQQDLARELLVLYALLCRLAPLASSQEISKIAPSGTSGIDPATFAEYSDALIRLQAKIGTHTQTARGLIAFPFMKEEIKEMLAKIERLKTAIGLGLDIKLL